MNRKRLNEIVDYVYNLYEVVQQINEIVNLGNTEIISRSDCMKLIDYSAKYRQIFTIEFIKRTTGEKRVMNGMTGVRRYVNGVGMPYDNKSKGLFTVYDLKAPGSGPKKYRQVPIDSITKLYIKKRLFKVVDDAQYNRINKPFDSQADKERGVEPAKGVFGKPTKQSPDQEKVKGKLGAVNPDAKPTGFGYKNKRKPEDPNIEPETDSTTDPKGRTSGPEDEEDLDEPNKGSSR